ncbi:MAG: hypothetical protein ACI97A_004155 [Planctomycetota bacterium]|jgi:hypothetical protein
MVVLTTDLSAQTTTRDTVHAQNVISNQVGNNQDSGGTNLNDILGDDTSNYWSPGSGGRIVVDFGANYTNFGDNTPDICVREKSDTDCYYLCFFPADAAIEAALTAAGMGKSNGYYESNTTYCGDLDLDIDALIPGFNVGEWNCLKVMILDDGNSGDGSEGETISCLICLSPPPSSDCILIWAAEVLDSTVGNTPNPSGSDPAAALGDTADTFYALGDGGSLKVGLGQNITTSGDDATDICIDELGVVDCYVVILESGSGSTFLALQDAGLTMVAPGQFMLSGTFCGDLDIDLDAIVSGFGKGELLFSSILLVDDSSGGDGAEINRVCALICNSTESPLAELGGCAFVDEDCTGILDAGEPGKTHVTVVLVGASDGLSVDFMMTDLAGKYRFKNLISDQMITW